MFQQGGDPDVENLLQERDHLKKALQQKDKYLQDVQEEYMKLLRTSTQENELLVSKTKELSKLQNQLFRSQDNNLNSQEFTRNDKQDANDVDSMVIITKRIGFSNIDLTSDIDDDLKLASIDNTLNSKFNFNNEEIVSPLFKEYHTQKQSNQ